MVALEAYRRPNIELARSGHPMALGLIAAFGVGCLGGLVAEFVSIAKHRSTRKSERPAEWALAFYWWIGIGWIACGGVLSSLESLQGPGLGALSAFTVGATAPLVFERLIRGSNGPGDGMPGSVG